MDKLILIGILALIGAMIGWFTNIIAVKLIFRPLYPVNLLGFKIQGLIPKRREEMASKIAVVVEEELISIEDIVEKATSKEDMKLIMEKIEEKIVAVIKEKVPAMFFPMVKGYIDEFVNESGEETLKNLINETTHKVAQRVSIKEIVEEKINSYDIEKIEEIIIDIAKTELKHIEVLGGVIGFFIGIVQGAIVIML